MYNSLHHSSKNKIFAFRKTNDNESANVKTINASQVIATFLHIIL